MLRNDRSIAAAAVTAAAVAAALCAALAAQTPDAARVLAAAREAMGGEKKLAAIKTFVATGRTRQVRGNNLVPIEFEINCELPDKYVRKDEFPAQEADPTTLGFNGEQLIQFPLAAAGPGAPPGRGGGPPPRLAAVKQDFARLALGMFAATFPAYPLTFKYAAQGQAPEGTADILDVSGPVNFSARFVVQQDTHLPVMLMWQQMPPAGRGGRGAPGDEPPKPVEHRIYYADYRDVDGVKLPFRIRRAIAGETVEETTFDRFRINVKIDPRKFEAAK